MSSIGATLAAEAGAWAAEDVLGAGALLAVGALARESRSRRRAARSLHALAAGATAAQVSTAD